MKQNKKLIAAIAAAVVLVAVFVGVWLGTRPQASAGNKTISVTIVHADESKKEFSERTDKDFLGEWMMEKGLVTETEYQSGFYTVIDGESAVWSEENQVYWALYEGEDYAMQGINDTPLTDGGSYSLIYTHG